MTGAQAAPLIEHLPGGVLLAQDGRIVAATGKAAELLGVAPSRLEGSQISAYLPPEALEVVGKIHEGATSCTSRGIAWDRPFAVDRITIKGSAGPEPGQVVLLVIEDGDPLASDAARGFRRRLAWLDSLAAGMAHEIRNPLAGIRGAAQLLQRELEPQEQAELTDLIIRESDRIDRLVERLMGLCRPRPLLRSEVSLNRLIHDEVALLRARSGGRSAVTFNLDLDPSLPTIEGDAERIREAASNLLRNAVEAANSQVIVRTRIETHQRLLDAGRDRGCPVALEVTDDGPGIEPARVSTLFDPFATSKAEGTGLGLFVTRLAIEQHKGRLLVDPRPERGARFTLVFYERLPAPNDADLNTWADSLSTWTGHGQPPAAEVSA
jgi:two-component system nitrogen regulation sensor histidine kinase GlnL